MNESKLDTDYIQHLLSNIFRIELLSFNKEDNSLGTISIVFNSRESAIATLYYFLFRLRNERIDLTIDEVTRDDLGIFTDMTITFDLKHKGIKLKTNPIGKYDHLQLVKFMNEVEYEDAQVLISCNYYNSRGEIVLAKLEDERLGSGSLHIIPAFIYTYNP